MGRAAAAMGLGVRGAPGAPVRYRFAISKNSENNSEFLQIAGRWREAGEPRQWLAAEFPVRPNREAVSS